MKVNVKLDLDDDDRRALASFIAGKPVKRLATRADVNEVLQDLLADALMGNVSPAAVKTDAADRVLETVRSRDLDTPVPEGERCTPECCRQNELLLARVNRLQHKLDTRRS